MKDKSEEKAKMKKVTVNVSEELWVELKVAAARERTTMGELISRLVEAYLKKREKGGKR